MVAALAMRILSSVQIRVAPPKQRIDYIIQYELQGTAVNPWAGNSTKLNVISDSNLSSGAGFQTAFHQFLGSVQQSQNLLLKKEKKDPVIQLRGSVVAHVRLIT